MTEKSADKAASEANERSQAFELLARIFRENASRYKSRYAVAIACLVVIAATTAFSAWIMRDVIDEIFVRQRSELIGIIAGSIVLAFAIRGVAMYGQAVIMAQIGNDLVARYQQRVFDKLMSLSVDYFVEHRSGQLAARLSQNVSAIRDVLSLTITAMARDLLSLIGLVAVMFIQDWRLTLITFLVGPPLFIAIAYITKRSRTIVRQSVTVNARVIGSLQEAVQGISVVKAFTMEDQLSKRISKIIREAQMRSDKLASVTQRLSPISEMLGGFAIAGVVAYGGWRTIEGGQPPGSMFSFITAVLLAYEPAKRLARLRVKLEKAMVNASMIYEIIDMEPRQRDIEGATTLQFETPDIEFVNVSFSYADGTEVLSGVNFTAPAKQVTAIVGPSGAGKTTIISLLERYYDPDEGQILIGGQPIGEVTKASLREAMALVSQSPYLFEGSIRDNIRYGRADATDDEIEEAAKLANAHEFIAATPSGYDTLIGENGVTLSGGQRQRLSIARAIVRNAPILLLDEATSALDNESEKLVQDALETVMRGRTTIVIAHRLSTIRNANKIIVMDRGEIVEEGDHQALTKKKNGLYAKLHALSSAGELPTVEHAEDADRNNV
ncbi:MAG: ABC transporter ATP-binding protein [Pseudomonadota bacterium]